VKEYELESKTGMGDVALLLGWQSPPEESDGFWFREDHGPVHDSDLRPFLIEDIQSLLAFKNSPESIGPPHVRVRVWHCCGPVLGYLIPWPTWMEWGIYPVADVEKPTIYIYSEYQQKPEWITENAGWIELHHKRKAAGLPTFLDVVNIDEFHKGEGYVDWPAVRMKVYEVVFPDWMKQPWIITDKVATAQLKDGA